MTTVTRIYCIIKRINKSDFTLSRHKTTHPHASITMISSFFAPKGKANIAPGITMATSQAPPKRSIEEGEEETALSNKKAKLSEVDQLLSYIIDNNNNDDDENTTSWRQALSRHTSLPSFQKLAIFVAQERNKSTIYPPPADTFSALSWTPLSEVKVVIVGQDPYHGPNQAHGLCFSVRKGVDIPPSLKNIYKELANDANVDFPSPQGMPRHGYLERWAKQGVLMLNNVLTVRKGVAHSHGKKGWEAFTDQVIRVLVKDAKDRNKGLVFLLWGKPANEKAINIIGASASSQNTVIQTSHPSPLGATKTKSPFMGSKCFSRANEALIEMDLEPIDWNVGD
jgi:uracil-DNA glycosylase